MGGIEHVETGPFSGEVNGRLSGKIITSGRSYGIITSESDATILKALIMFKSASRNQISEYTGLSHQSLKKSIPRLCRLGYIDRLETGKTPPLYMLGPESLKMFNMKADEWHILKAFRIAAANQLYLKMYEVWPDLEYTAEPHQGLTALIRKKDTEYGIIAPRIWPGEVDWCRDMVELAPDDVRIIIVAGSKTLAEECARVIKEPRPLRFTWDGILKEKAVFYQKKGNMLIAAENFSLTEAQNAV